jgi:S-formylglutathione hydrolase FrmB
MPRQAGHRPEDRQAREDPATVVATHVAHALVRTVAGLSQPRPNDVEVDQAE